MYGEGLILANDLTLLCLVTARISLIEQWCILKSFRTFEYQIVFDVFGEINKDTRMCDSLSLYLYACTVC